MRIVVPTTGNRFVRPMAAPAFGVRPLFAAGGGPTLPDTALV
jgi:hypothetical protein